MITLTPSQIAQVKALTNLAYPLFSLMLRTIFNEQLLESRGLYEFEDWMERVELTRQYFEGSRPNMKIARPRKLKPVTPP